MYIYIVGAVAYSDAYFGSGSGPYYLDDVQCRGSEVSLLSCRQAVIGVHNCRAGNEAGVKCVDGKFSVRYHRVCIKHPWFGDIRLQLYRGWALDTWSDSLDM